MRKLRVRLRILEPGDASSQAMDVVRDQVQGALLISTLRVIRRDAIVRIVGEELEPFVELPLVEQRRFAIQEVLDVLPVPRPLLAHASAGDDAFARMYRSHQIQNSRRCSSSVLSWSPSFAMPR